MNKTEHIQDAELVQQNAVALRPSYQPPSYMTKEDRAHAVSDTLNKVALVMEIMDQAMRDGEHYGKIPGCGDKKALLKPGAEKLGLTFKLKPQFDIRRTDFPNNHREYEIKCTLSDGTQGVGTCSTLESKYRYRASERKCPKCGKATIIKGKVEYGGGWLCFAKKGGCNAKFGDDDKTITSQETGKTEHDNPPDFWNTCLKMGKKRAHVDAIITATACSDIFTQDIEETIEAANATQPEPSEPPSRPQAHNPPPATREQQPNNTGGASLPKGKTVETLLQSARLKCLEELHKIKLPQVWCCLVRRGAILPTETIEGVTETGLFPTASQFAGELPTTATYEAAQKALKGDHDALLHEIKLVRPTDDEAMAFDAVYGTPGNAPEPEKPRPAKAEASTDASSAEWFWAVICPIPNKGQKKVDYEKDPDTIEGLYKAAKANDENARKRLFGFAHKWNPESREYNGKTYPPSEADLKFRKALDAFLAYEESKAADGCVDAHAAAEEESNSVPF